MSAAERAKRFRRRQRRGLAVLRIEADEHALAGALMDAGLLHPDNGSREALEAAAAAALSDFVSRYSATRYGAWLKKHDRFEA